MRTLFLFSFSFLFYFCFYISFSSVILSKLFSFFSSFLHAPFLLLTWNWKALCRTLQWLILGTYIRSQTCWLSKYGIKFIFNYYMFFKCYCIIFILNNLRHLSSLQMHPYLILYCNCIFIILKYHIIITLESSMLLYFSLSLLHLILLLCHRYKEPFSYYWY